MQHDYIICLFIYEISQVKLNGKEKKKLFNNFYFFIFNIKRKIMNFFN